MSQRIFDCSYARRESVPDLIRRHSSLLASLKGDGIREGRRSDRRLSTSELEREFPNLRSTARRSTCQSVMEEEPQSLSLEELEQLLDNCMKLTRDNQLTEKRLWGLALPQHMPDLVKQNAEHDHVAFNFQKVSFGLDAAVQIYSKRVDSMHNSALDTRSRLTNQQKQKDASVEVEAVEVTARRRVRRHSDFGGDSTLATNLDMITAKGDADDAPPVDPLFHKVSALFDARGFKGLPTLNLGIKQGGRYVLDMTEVPGQAVYRGYDLPPNHKLDLDSFGLKFEPLNEMQRLSPSSSRLYNMIGRPEHNRSMRELIQRGMNAVALRPKAPDEEENCCDLDQDCQEEQMNGNDVLAMNAQSEIHIENDVDDAGCYIEDNHDNFANSNGDETNLPPIIDEDDGPEGQLAGTVIEGNGALNFTFEVADEFNATDAAAEVDLLDEETISWLLDPRHDKAPKSRAWTGASHWKYPSTSAKPEAAETDTQNRRREPKGTVDFVRLPETDVSKFKKADRETSISTQFKEEDSHLLPTDYKFDASFLLQLPLMPSVKPLDWLWRCQAKERNLPGADGHWDDLNEQQDLDFPEVAFDGWGEDMDDQDLEFGLIAAPPQIEEDTFQIEVTPNRVNMSQLKAKIWEMIEELARDGATQEIPLCTIAIPLTREMGVTFGVCFACVLHLAIEHNFHVVSNEAGEASIIMND